MWDQFTNYSCMPDPADAPCSGQGYPPYVVDAYTAEHVKVGIEFAREHRLRLVVKNTGHDFLGRSIGPGALSIWTHHLKTIEFHPGGFELAGSGQIIRGNAMTLGGGVQLFEAYQAADKYGQTIVGGNGRSVGIGGYIAGGGHSFLSPHFGLGVDNVLQMEVVTPMGQILMVNEHRYPDLFWALRGGGGSTFGVITKVTMSTHPKLHVTNVLWKVIVAPKAPYRWDVVSYVASKLPYLIDSGLSGANFIDGNISNSNTAHGLPYTVAGMTGRNIAIDKDGKTVDKIFKPIKDTLDARWPGKAFLSVETKEYGDFFAWYKENYDHSTGGYSRYLVSRLLDKRVLEGDVKALKPALKAGSEPNALFGLYAVGGKGVRNAKPRGGNSVHPAWRKAYVHTGRCSIQLS
ncbi:hypothetical protein CDD83_9372 [Cordyceps sp. RAO-2017]|nr:hypothetical protein CDD83_9372 [Cordyceps sp. RAO-2017]